MSEDKNLPAKIEVKDRGLKVSDFDQMYRVSRIMAASGLMPKGINTPEQVFVAVQFGAELGLSPMQSVQNIAPINGRPTIWGDAALGIVMGSGLLEDIEETQEGEGDKLVGICRVRRCGGKDVIRKFSLKQAKHAKLVDKSDAWQKYPERMCQMRARAFALRDVFPDILKGIHAREEFEGGDIIDIEAVTPAKKEFKKREDAPTNIYSDQKQENAVADDTGDVDAEIEESLFVPAECSNHDPEGPVYNPTLEECKNCIMRPGCPDWEEYDKAEDL